MPEYAIPVMFTVSGEDRESAARALVTALAATNPQTHEPSIEAFWLPEMDLQHVDGNDNEPYVLVPLADVVERADAGQRIVDWVKAEPERRADLIDRVFDAIDAAEPTITVRHGLFSTRVTVH